MPCTKFYLLVDCNHFFVSCERVFQPHLVKKPVIVLSRNDGCVISRSSEAKSLGIPMGAPFFMYKEVIERHKVSSFSSNFSLYSDFSCRVMAVLQRFSPEIEQYSIDEAFLLVTDTDPELLAQEIRQTILKWTGIPVSIGIGPTKTLAKLASDKAKKVPDGVFQLVASDPILQKTPVGDVWGIGYHLKTRLQAEKIVTAHDITQANDHFLRKKFTVMLLRIAYELKGIPCLMLEDTPAPKQSITYSRSFSPYLTELAPIQSALCSFVEKALAKLRLQNSCCRAMTVFLATSRHQENYYASHQCIQWPYPSNYTPDFLSAVKKAASALFLPGRSYKKAGIILFDISPDHLVEQDMLTSSKLHTKNTALMQALDQINQKYGKQTLRFAATPEQDFFSKKERSSQAFTTEWDDLLIVNLFA